MHLLHNLRNSINWLASPLGFAIQRTRKMKWHLPNSIIETKVGRFVIQVPGINPAFSYFETNQEFVSQLGRLTSLVRKKYPAMAAIDIGANVGDTACIIKTAEDVPLLCVEGDDKSFEFLQKNLAQFQNATAHKLFLGEKTDTISASLACAGFNTTILPGLASASASKSIKLMKFDDFIVTQPGWENYKLMKIDTEGFDCAILRGSKKFIRQVSPVIFFEYNRQSMELIGESGIDTLFQLAELGYSRIMFHDDRGRFVGTTTLSDRETIRDWHDYADGKNSEIYYLDITVFHEHDTDLALEYLAAERAHRHPAIAAAIH
jgi:FkbM family methyltransferase